MNTREYNSGNTAKLKAVLDAHSIKLDEAMALIRANKNPADPNEPNSKGNTLLHVLGTNKQHQHDMIIIELLETYEASPNIGNKNGDALLHLLVRNNANGQYNATIAAAIKTYGADIHQQNNAKQTPLQSLMNHPSYTPEGAVKLVELGANPEDQDLKRKTLLDRLDDNTKAKLIAAHKTAQLKALLDSSSLPVKEAMALIKAGADANVKADNGNTLVLRLVGDSEYNALVDELVKEYKADLNQKDETGYTPLQQLLNDRSYSPLAAMRLIELGANPNDQDRDGRTVLHKTMLSVADNAHKFSIVKGLTKQGANPRQADKEGRTVFHIAAHQGDLTIGKWLFDEKKAEINAKNQFGNTPLFYACVKGRLDFVKWLHSIGATLTVKNQIDQTLLHAAAMANDLALVTWLVESGKIDLAAIDSNKDTALAVNKTLAPEIRTYLEAQAQIQAAEKAKQAAAEATLALEKLLNSISFSPEDAMKLVRLGANPAVEDTNGNSLLHKIIFANGNRKRDTLIEELISKTNINSLNKPHGRTVLLSLMEIKPLPGKLAYIKWLTEKGAKLTPDTQGRTALHLAASAGDLEVAQWLVLEQKADIHAQTSLGSTPLFYACSTAKLNFAQWLVNQGARLADKNKKNQTHLHAAVLTNDLPTVQWLAESKEVELTALDTDNHTILTKNAHIVPALKSYLEPLFNTQPQAKQVVATQATRALKQLLDPAKPFAPTAATALVAQGADINGEDVSGETALFYACRKGALEAAKGLVGLGARLTDKNKKQQTLLHMAALSNKVDMVAWLVDSGKIDVQAVDEDGKDALSINPKLSKEIKAYLETRILAAQQAQLAAAAAAAAAIAAKKQQAFDLFKQKHEMSLDKALFSFIKKIFSKMRNFLFNDPTQPIKTMDDVTTYAKSHTSTRTAHILTMMNTKMTVQEFKTAYEDARSKQWFSNPFETTMRDSLKTLDTAGKVAAFKMEKIIDHAISRPDSLTAEIIRAHTKGPAF